MLIKISRRSDVRSSEITPKSLFEQRRKFLQSAAVAGAGLAVGAIGGTSDAFAAKFPHLTKTRWNAETVGKELTPIRSVTGYNNFYEFGTGKTDPFDLARDFQPKPWSVKVDGLCENPGTYAYEDLADPNKLEERVYRFRCVEAWSMVVPWVGIPLGNIIKRMAPTGDAKYVAFETLHDPDRMPGQRRMVLDWPYREGLRMDEAMNPLTLLTVGLYGEELPNQNGAPIRLIVPWKYGFKSIKSIVRISFTEKQPQTSWNMAAPGEYGFYSNVNPNVSHPRWSQAKERTIGAFLKTPTHLFNGYQEEVASLYTGMDLKKFY